MRRARNEPVVAAIPMSLEIPRYGVGVQDRVRVLKRLGGGDPDGLLRIGGLGSCKHGRME